MSIILRQDFWTFVCPTGSYFGSHQVVREGLTSKTTDVPWKNVQSLFNTNTTACIANPLSLILYHLSSHLFRVIYLNNVLTFQKGSIRDELLSPVPVCDHSQLKKKKKRNKIQRPSGPGLRQ